MINPVGAALGMGSQGIADVTSWNFTEFSSADIYAGAAPGVSIAGALTGNKGVDPQAAAAIGSAISAALRDALEVRNGVDGHSGQEIIIDTTWAAVYGYGSSFITSSINNPASANFLSTAISGYSLGKYNLS